VERKRFPLEKLGCSDIRAGVAESLAAVFRRRGTGPEQPEPGCSVRAEFPAKEATGGNNKISSGKVKGQEASFFSGLFGYAGRAGDGEDTCSAVRPRQYDRKTNRRLQIIRLSIW